MIYTINNQSVVMPKVLQMAFKTKESPNYFQYPYIDRDCMHQAMDNYRQRVYEYNQWVRKENVHIRSYNNLVAAQLKAVPLTKEQQGDLESFYNRNKGVLPVKYNQRVAIFNKKRPAAQKVLHKEIRYQTELIFNVLLCFYAGQLKQRNTNYQALGQKVAGTLPHLKINTRDIAIHKKNEIERLDVSKRTIQRHLKRLREANILVGYVFRGSNLPVKSYIHSDILKVKDAYKSAKTNGLESDSYDKQTTSCPNRHRYTRTLKDHKKKGDVDNIPLERKTPHSLHSLSDKNLVSQEHQRRSNAQKSILKKSWLSEFLSTRIQEQGKLAADLSEHRYDHYEPIPIDDLQREADKGTMSVGDFKTLVLQDFLMSSASLWKNTTPYEGSWLSAYYMLEEDHFLSSRGTIHKDTMVQQIIRWRWMLAHAKRWFEKNNMYTVYPHQYFDSTRKTAKEGGFFYCYKAYRQNEQKKEKRKLQKQQRRIAAKRRRKRLTDHRKAIIAIKNYLDKKINLEKLHDYIESNLSKNFLKELPKMIDNENLKRFK